MLVDSRFPEEMSIPFIVKLLKKHRKPLLKVATKGDLITPKARKELEAKQFVVISSKKKKGRTKLMSVLTSFVEKKLKSWKKPENVVYVAIMGYPDVGKSSLINYITGRKKTKVSPIAHTTRGQQYIKLNQNIMLVDTPGIFGRENVTSLALKGAISPEQLSDAVPVVLKIILYLIKKNELNRLTYYGFKINTGNTVNAELIVEHLIKHVARKRNLKIKAGKYNTDEAAKIIMRDFQRGLW